MTSEITLEEIRAQADALGVSYHHKAGIAKIQEAISVHQSQTADVETEVPAGPPADAKGPLSQSQFDKLKFPGARQKVSALRRVRIMCMDPAKREWPGMFISVGSSKLGTFKKYIPFNDEPYHIPQIIYDHLQERMFSSFSTVKNERGDDVRKSKLVPEFNIVDLPPLTEVELEELAQRQQLANVGL